MRFKKGFFACVLLICSVVFFFGVMTRHVTEGPTQYLTWEVPGFAYINNQIILHVSANLFNPTDRVIISPNLRFPPIHETEEQYVSLESLFSVKEVPYNGAAIEIDTIYDAKNSEADYVKVTNKYESFWSYMYTRFVVYLFIIGGRWREQAYNVMSQYRFPLDSPITRCVTMAMDQYPIADSVGIHLRTWGGGVSLVGSRECEVIHKNNPLKLLWLCRMEADRLYDSISQVPSNVPVFITTDDPSSETIIQLKNQNKDRVVFLVDYTKLLDECFIEEDGLFTKKWMSVHGLAFIDSELLSKSHMFIGNIFSTFSNIVAIKRPRNTYFLQTRMQYVLEQYLFYWIALGFLLIVTIPIVILRYLTRRPIYDAVKNGVMEIEV